MSRALVEFVEDFRLLPGVTSRKSFRNHCEASSCRVTVTDDALGPELIDARVLRFIEPDGGSVSPWTNRRGIQHFADELTITAGRRRIGGWRLLSNNMRLTMIIARVARRPF